MKKFSELGIKVKRDRFVGDKIKMFKILNQEIVVHDFRIKNSKYDNANSDKCLHLQIEVNGQKHVLFTGSKVLAETIEQVPREAFPFETKITQEGETFQFN